MESGTIAASPLFSVQWQLYCHIKQSAAGTLVTD